MYPENTQFSNDVFIDSEAELTIQSIYYKVVIVKDLDEEHSRGLMLFTNTFIKSLLMASSVCFNG